MFSLGIDRFDAHPPHQRRAMTLRPAFLAGAAREKIARGG